MGDLVLVQAQTQYDQSTFARMIDILENTFSNISTVFAQVKKSAYQLDANVVPSGNVSTPETVMMTYTMQPNVLGKMGYNVNITAYGTFAANANNKRIRLYFGSSVIFDSTALALNGGTWALQATVTRITANTQQALVTVTSNNTTLVNSVVFSSIAQNLVAAVIIKCTGTATATNDIVENGQLIKVFPKE